LKESPVGADAVTELVWYAQVVLRRRYVVLACIGTAITIALLVNALSVPIYRATTTIQIDPQAPEILTFENIMAGNASFAAYHDFYQTQYTILKSKSVVRLAAERLDLPNRPEFAGRRERPIGRLARWVRSLLPRSAPSKATGEKPDPLAPAIAFIQANTNITPVRDSQIVLIDVEDRSRQLARDLSNAIAEAYLQFNYENVYGTTTVAREFLTKEVARVQQEISDLEARLQEYGAEKRILSVDSGTQDISQQSLTALNSRAIEAQARLAVAQARWQAVEGVAPSSLPEVLQSALISNLRQKYADLERERSQLAERFGPSWPALQQIEQEMTQARERLQIETEAIAEQVRAVSGNEYLRAKAEVENLKKQLEHQKDEVQRVNRDAIEYASLQSEIESKRAVLAELASRKSQTAASERLRETGTSNIRIIDPAETPNSPIRPRKMRNLLVALAVGLFSGLALAFLLDFLDNTVKDEEDVQRIAGMPVLGHVPHYRTLRAVPSDASGVRDPVAAEIDLVSHADSLSPFAEAFKNVRTSLLLASPEHPPRGVVVTSCDSEDGKSTVTTNLAIALAQMDRRVLLVDADLRRPRIHRSFGVTNDLGLSNLLSGNARAEEVLRDTDVPGLSIIASGPIPPNPSELLGAPSLRAFLVELEKEHGFDHVILDSPPVGAVTDAVLLSMSLDVMIVVVRAGKTTREFLARTSARLEQSHVRVAGAVLNDVAADSRGYLYGSYRHYRSTASQGEIETAASKRRLLRWPGRKAGSA